MSVRIGEKAPHFSLYASDKTLVSLSDYDKKNVLLLFFPFAFSRTCNTELCGVRDTLADYEAIKAQVLAISIDSVYTLAQYAKRYKFTFPLLSDFNKEVARAYGSLYEAYKLGMRGVAKRSAFVIDRRGILRYAEVLESDAQLPDFEAIKTTISRLK